MSRRPDLDATLQRGLAEFPKDSKPRAIAAAIRVDGRLIWSSSDSIFSIYSITKTLTAICALRLCEMRRLALTDPVEKWLPHRKLKHANVTLAHLLRHRSGLGDYGPLAEYHAAVRATPGEPWTPQQFFDTVLAQRGHTPDELFSYSNVGYMVAVEILECVTGKRFAQIVHDFVVEPLALHDTFVVEQIADWGRCVPGFGREVDARNNLVDIRQSYHPGWCAPRVAASTPEEITSVFDALLAGRLLQPAMLSAMLAMAPLSPREGETVGAGMGLFCDRDVPHGTNYGHGGGGPGYELTASVIPDTRLGRVAIAVFANHSPEPNRNHVGDIEAALLATLLERHL